MKALALVIIAACGAAEGKPSAPLHVADAAPDDPVGAVPLPDPDARPSLEEVDTTIEPVDLTATQGTYEQDVRGLHDTQLVALHVRDGKLWLSFIVGQNDIVKPFELGPIESVPALHTIDGDAYAPRRDVADYKGPILFAIRLRRGRSEPWHQLVVFIAGDEIRVVERQLEVKPWTRRLRVRLDRGTTVEAIGTTDPH